MTLHARGTFEVQLAPQPLAHAEADVSLGRLSIDKRFQGDLSGLSQGELEGLTGTMALLMADGVHAYDLAYTLPDAR